MNMRIAHWESLLKDLAIPYAKRSTGAIYILCPFHKERTPSLRIWPDTGGFRCFGCHKGGTVKDFVENLFPDVFPQQKTLERTDPYSRWAYEYFYRYCFYDPQQQLLEFMRTHSFAPKPH